LRRPGSSYERCGTSGRGIGCPEKIVQRLRYLSAIAAARLWSDLSRAAKECR
jgi:hypothetical protein